MSMIRKFISSQNYIYSFYRFTFFIISASALEKTENIIALIRLFHAFSKHIRNTMSHIIDDIFLRFYVPSGSGWH